MDYQIDAARDAYERGSKLYDDNIISEQERDEIWNDNVLQWLFGEDQSLKDKLIQQILAG